MNKNKLTDDPDYHNKWYHNNRDKILAKMKTKVTCQCGLVVIKTSMRRHLMSKKHNTVMNL